MTLQNYEVTFAYITGNKNTAADALSRNINSDKEIEKSTTICNVVEMTASDETDQYRTEKERKVEGGNKLFRKCKSATKTKTTCNLKLRNLKLLNTFCTK